VKRLLLLVVLGALVVAASGCDLSPPAATVNGVAISQSTLNAELSTLIANHNAQCAAQLAAGLTTSPVGVGTEGDGTTPNAVTPTFADNALETLVLEQLEQQTLARHKVAVTGADLTDATTDYESQLQQQLDQVQSENETPSGCTLSTTSALSAQLPRGFLRQETRSLADQEMFEVAVGHVNLSSAALQSYYTAHLSEVTQECLNVIVSDTQAAAQTVHNLIAAGASFATASTSSSADTQATPSGGELACEYPATAEQQFGTTLATTIDALASGQLAEPMAWQTESSTGTSLTEYVVVQMRQHQIVPFATLAESIREAILEAHSSVVSKTLEALVVRAHVSVDARFGGWSPKHGVTIPTPPPPAFVLNAKANVPLAPAASTPGLSIPVSPSSG
jgi:hypothetical protein